MGLMRRPFSLFVVVFGLAAGATAQSGLGPPSADEMRPSFEDWLGGVRDEAIAAGLKPDVVKGALQLAEHLDVVVDRDRQQTEFVLALDVYLKRRLTREVVRTARERYRRHRELLSRVAARYGVEPYVLVAVWGLESNFGRFAGTRPTISVLATLGYEGRRGEFFRGQLIEALRILDRGDIEAASMRGSWAGAMGQPQFMPGSYSQYAVDFDADGRRDIWDSEADVFASIANYLTQNGWEKGERWGREVKVTAEAARRIADRAAFRDRGCRATRELSEPLPLAEWRALGVRLASGRALPRAKVEASLLRAGTRSFLVYRNYDAILSYNCANSYGISVALLSDRIARR
jgi:membrane-bound lytic murein transglycosylase B